MKNEQNFMWNKIKESNIPKEGSEKREKTYLEK